MNILNQTKALAFLLAAATIFQATAADTSAPASKYIGQLSAVSKLELPAKSASLVSQAESKSRPQVTVDVVKSAVGLNPAAAVNIVGSIAKATPDMAPVAAGTAVSLVPNQAVSIARVATAAAPAQAGKIVEAICRVLPKQYKEIALAVAEIAPQQGKEILAGVAAGVPALQAPLAKATAGETPTVAKVLDQVTPTTGDLAGSSAIPAASGATPLSGPTFGGPYVSLPPSNQNLDPGSGTDVPSGGRNYATP